MSSSSSSLPPSWAQPTKAFGSAVLGHRRHWHGDLGPLLRPIVRAYLLGYGFTVGPRLLTVLAKHLSQCLGAAKRQRATSESLALPKQSSHLVESLCRILSAGAQVNHFPTFCAALVGGSTLLEPLLRKACARILQNCSETNRIRLLRWLSSAISAWFAIQLLQTPSLTHTDTKTPMQRDQSTSTSSPPTLPFTSTGKICKSSSETARPQAGRTLDLTLFAATRALDVIIGELWAQRRLHRAPTASKATRALDYITSLLTDPLIFSLTSGIVMWNWFYAPQALPRAYNKWIASAASVDERLVVALQRCRAGILRYGQDTGQAPLLRSMCNDYAWPPVWGDPQHSIPFPCEMVHMGAGPSCELHALRRFCRAWLWSMKTYLPLQLLMLVVRIRSRSSLLNVSRDFWRSLISASRSSAFLGAFITLFYYGVCLARTRIGPLVLGTTASARDRIDGGLCVGAGCCLCGWSVLIETASRRKELALFVAPRAMATLLPRQYDAGRQWMERAVFAASTGVIFTCVLENTRRVRGVFGSLLRTVLVA
ncbi:integral membrane protein [Coniella lustricola]|uniref:Integral membrane protein n=1 Tax=Coniella lustricola TaxID=2025994 RepID=A0A2T3ADV3_9PEZI|nr:integral membrane protein [Coniella lustricola]